MEAETSYFSLINVNATHFTSTPTVCGHAEACPSTTYTKYIPNDARTSRARWGGYISTFFATAGRVLSGASIYQAYGAIY